MPVMPEVRYRAGRHQRPQSLELSDTPIMPFERCGRVSSQQSKTPRRARYLDDDHAAAKSHVKEDLHDIPNIPRSLEPPNNWPQNVNYLSIPFQSPYLTDTHKKWLNRKPQGNPENSGDALSVIRLPLTRTKIDSTITVELIDDKKHPAHGQRGLFAARSLVPGELIVPYIGYVHSSTASEREVRKEYLNAVSQSQQADERDTKVLSAITNHTSEGYKGLSKLPDETNELALGSWDISSYDLNLHRDEDIELAIDAERMGNEARFFNDYRGVPASDVADRRSNQWNRKAKRAAKTWSAEGADGGQELVARSGMPIPMAIPNAEFRDVWLEWAPEEDVDLVEDGTAMEVAEDGMTRLDLEEKVPETKHARRQRRRRQAGMRGVAIFVMPAGKSGKRKHGIQAGEEVLVSYGKGFWSHHGLEVSVSVSDMVQTQAQEREALG